MITDKMINAFKTANGGLFEKSDKADIGDGFALLANDGVDLMGWADPFMPDRSMPEFLEDALIKEIKDNSSSHYTVPVGSSDLKKALAKKLKEKNHLDVDPLRNIIITPGSDSGLYFAILPFINKEDEVIIPCPSYPNNFLDVEIMGGKVIPVELHPEDNYQLHVEDMEKVVTDKTKMVILTHPNNPTTTVYNKESLEALRSFIIKHDLVLVVDQAFEDFTYENEFITPASMPDMFDRTVTVFSFSKGMGLSGLRIAYIVANDHVMNAMYANAVAVIGAASTTNQRALITALEHPEFQETFRKAYQVRRKAAYEILNSIPDVSCTLPESGFLCWVNISKLGSSNEISDYLIKHAKVACNEGSFYGPGGEGYLRIVLGVYKDDHKVIDALNRIKKALTDYHKSF